MKPKSIDPWRSRAGKLPLLAVGIASLLFGLWGGLVRLPINLPIPENNANWITFHGPIMVCGFLGTVIALERAVGLRRGWTYLAPILAGAGAIAIVAGQLGRPPQLLVTAGSAWFALVAVRVVQLQRAPHTILMAIAAGGWLVGNVLWLRDWPINRLVPWYFVFLGLTIVGERLDLSRFQKPVEWAQPLLVVVVGVLLTGVILSGWRPAVGLRLMGAGWLATALWLFRFDLARRTIRQPGLPRFMAACLLSGYFWLAVSGALFLVLAPAESGLPYDAALHTFFLGFVFAMIFGHAPVIFPAVLGLAPLEMRGRFYAHLILLHASLVLRLSSDLTGWATGRQWGAILNGVAIVVFLANTVASIVGRLRSGSPGTRAAGPAPKASKPGTEVPV